MLKSCIPFSLFPQRRSSQKCDGGRCVPTHLKLEAEGSDKIETKTKTKTKKKTVARNGVECPICYEVKDKLGMLKGCEHVFCADCLKAWRTEDRERGCPYCRQPSKVAVYGRLAFSGPEKERLFAEHALCRLEYDPILRELYSLLTDDWKTLVERILLGQLPNCSGGMENVQLEIFALGNRLKIRSVGRRHASFERELDDDDDVGGDPVQRRQRRQPDRRVLVCRRTTCCSLQVTLSTYDPFHVDGATRGYDDAYADEAVRAINRVLAETPESFPRLVCPRSFMNFVLRRFENVFCMLTLVWSGDAYTTALVDRVLRPRRAIHPLLYHNVRLEREEEEREAEREREREGLADVRTESKAGSWFSLLERLCTLIAMEA